HKRDDQLIQSSQNGNFVGHYCRQITDQTVQVANTAPRLASQADHHITFAKTCALHRAVAFYRQIDDPALDCWNVETYKRAIEWRRLGDDSDVTAPNPAIPQQTAGYKLGGIDADGEA